MKKTAAAITAGMILVLGLLLLSNNSSDGDAPTSDHTTPQNVPQVTIAAARPQNSRGAAPSAPAAPDDSAMTKEQFEKLSPQEQDEIIDRFVARF